MNSAIVVRFFVKGSIIKCEIHNTQTEEKDMEKLKNIFPVAKFKSLIGIAVGVIVIIPMTTLPTYQLQEVLDAPLKSEEMNVAQSQGQEIGNEEFANQDVAQEVEEEIESIQVIYKEKPFTGKVEVGDILIFGKYGYNISP